MHAIQGQMFVSATVQKPICSEKNKSQHIFSTKIDFTNLYVASLVYLSRIICALAPFPKDVVFVVIFPQQKSQHNVIRTRISFAIVITV